MSLIFPNSDYLKRIFNNASRRDWREDLKKRMIHFDLEKCNYYQKLQQCGLGNDLTENWHVAIYQQVMLKNSKKCIHVNCRSYLVLIYLRVWYEKMRHMSLHKYLQKMSIASYKPITCFSCILISKSSEVRKVGDQSNKQIRLKCQHIYNLGFL